MKVLLINSVCGIKSTGRICTDIAEECLSQGYEVKIAYGCGEVPEKYKDIALLADLMGHESIETTRIYLRCTAGEQQELVDKIVTW